MSHLRTIAARITHLEIWCVGATIAAGITSARLLPLAFIVAGLFWALRWFAYNKIDASTPCDWPIGLLLVLVVLSNVLTPWPVITNIQSWRFVSGVALYYTVSAWAKSAHRLHLLIGCMMAIGIPLALAMPFGIDWSTMVMERKLPFVPASLYAALALRVTDPINPNVAAGTLALLFPCALALLLFGWKHVAWPYRLLAFGAVLSMFGITIVTGSRGGILAMGVSVLAAMLLRWRGTLPVLAVLTAIGSLTFRSLGGSDWYQTYAVTVSTRELEARMRAWAHALYMIRDFPVTGIGMGSFENVLQLVYPFPPTTASVPHAHNLFLQVAVDLGIPGLIAWLAVLFLTTVAAWRVFRHGRAMHDGWTSAIGAGLVCSQVALVVHGLVDAVTWGMVRTAVIPWGLWGLAIASQRVLVSMQGRAEDALK